MAKTPAALSKILIVSILAAALPGCMNKSAPSSSAPTSPDANQKDPTKNPSGTSAAGPTGTVGAAGGVSSPQSPDLAAKTPTISPGTPPAAGAEATPLKGPDFKDATHVLTDNEPYYLATPAQDAKADGVLAAGSPVLVLIPSATYTKVKIGNGTEAYVSTAALKPTGK